MNAPARVWSEHQPVQPNAANEVPHTEDEAAAFFTCLTYRCGMLGRGCAVRFQKRAAGPALGHVDQLDGCKGCAAGAARALLLDVAEGKKTVRVGIAPPYMSATAAEPKFYGKFRPVLATRADRNLAKEEPDPCAECGAARQRINPEKRGGPQEHLCWRCSQRADYRAARAVARKHIDAARAFSVAVEALSGRLWSARTATLAAWDAARAGLGVLQEAASAPYSLPVVPTISAPTVSAPVGNCQKCGRWRKYETPASEGRPEWCRRCNQRHRTTEAVKHSISQPKNQAEKAEDAMSSTQHLNVPLAPCSKCGRHRFYQQRRNSGIGDPTRCATCNKGAGRKARRDAKRAEKAEAVKRRLADVEVGGAQTCPRCLREATPQYDRVRTPVEAFCSTCINIARRCNPSLDDQGLLGWLVAHPSRLDEGVPCRGCGAMRHSNVGGINAAWCSSCRKNAMNICRRQDMEATDEAIHQALLRTEDRRKRRQQVPTGRVAEAVTSATAEVVAENGQGRAVYFDATRSAIEASRARWRERFQAIEYLASREGDYLATKAAS